ncbi:MAG: alpha-L-fucosidase [Acidobacteria bacterium]|nr:alpha-L-fucosidase [Acidobacteriota bacterium]
MSSRLLSLLLLLAACVSAPAQNKPERLEWFRDLGFGLFIHWSLDSQVGSVISHSLVGASLQYVERFFTELPRTFNPTEYDPVEWARLAKLSGFQYVVFTTKHHSGFCMFDTKTTDFSIMNTPYGRDITAELVQAFRAEGIPIGFYFSPDDFHFLSEQGTLLSRRRPEVFPENNPGLMKHDLAQIRELMTNYGPVDVLFLDGPPEGLRELAWQIQPNVVVTRGAIETPEQYTPGLPLEGAWEGNLTMGVQWQYRPTNDTLKSGTELLRTLIETRAKGGNLLLNIAPHPRGSIPGPQEDRLREIALWMLVNRDSIYDVRPWIITNEADIWFTRSKDGATLYALVAGEPWKYAEEKTLLLRSVRLGAGGAVRVLGQNDKALEYRPEVVPATHWRQTEAGLEISATRAQRLYNDRRWPNPVVLAIGGAEPNLQPPVVLTLDAERQGSKTVLHGRLDSLGDADSLEVAFEVRRLKDMADLYEPDDPWRTVEAGKLAAPGAFAAEAPALDPARTWEFRAVVRHPAITLYGAVKPVAP